MKKFILFISLSFLLGISAVSAQNININLDKQPAWGPSGYDYAGYYYLPDINVYFDIDNSLFYYLNGGKWISGQYLPDKYKKYDLYNMYKVVLTEKQPWLQNKSHKKLYSQYKGNKTQEPIRNNNNSKYNASRGNNRSWVNSDKGNTNSSNRVTTSSSQSNRTNARQSDNSQNKNGQRQQSRSNSR